MKRDDKLKPFRLNGSLTTSTTNAGNNCVNINRTTADGKAEFDHKINCTHRTKYARSKMTYRENWMPHNRRRVNGLLWTVRMSLEMGDIFFGTTGFGVWWCGVPLISIDPDFPEE